MSAAMLAALRAVMLPVMSAAMSAALRAVTLPVMLAALRAVTLPVMLPVMWPYGQCAGRVGSLWVSRHLPIQF